MNGIVAGVELGFQCDSFGTVATLEKEMKQCCRQDGECATQDEQRQGQFEFGHEVWQKYRKGQRQRHWRVMKVKEEVKAVKRA